MEKESSLFLFSSRDMVYIASPAQIHVISMAEVMDGDATNHNGNGSQSSWRRMGLTVMEQGDGELVPDRFCGMNLGDTERGGAATVD